MKKFRVMALLASLMALIMIAFTLSGCYDGDFVEEKGMFLGYSKSKKKAFVGQLRGDLEHTEFVIDDKYKGYPITTLGGFVGRGFPCPFDFDIELPEEYREYVEQQRVFATNSSTFDYTGDGWETIVFHITLGRNICEIKRAEPCAYIGIIVDDDENGIPVYDILYKIVPYFIVPEDNATFYAEDGRLYYKNSGTPAGEFEYE